MRENINFVWSLKTYGVLSLKSLLTSRNKEVLSDPIGPIT